MLAPISASSNLPECDSQRWLYTLTFLIGLLYERTNNKDSSCWEPKPYSYCMHGNASRLDCRPRKAPLSYCKCWAYIVDNFREFLYCTEPTDRTVIFHIWRRHDPCASSGVFLFRWRRCAEPSLHRHLHGHFISSLLSATDGSFFYLAWTGAIKIQIIIGVGSTFCISASCTGMYFLQRGSWTVTYGMSLTFPLKGVYLWPARIYSTSLYMICPYFLVSPIMAECGDRLINEPIGPSWSVSENHLIFWSMMSHKSRPISLRYH